MEYFNDLTIVAAAHQITVVYKDSDIVKHMRWRYDKLLQPSDFVDKKMWDLLIIPQTRKEEADSLEIRDVTHPRQTRAKVAYNVVKAAQTQIELKNSQALTEDDDYINETRRMNSKNQNLLREYPDGVYMYLNMSNGERCLSLNAPYIEILRNPKAELLDTIVYAGINVVKLSVPKESISEIFILHPQLGEKLRDMNHPQESLIKWFTYCCPMETTTIVFPYCHSGHWSIAIFEVDKRIVWTLNSIARSHHELPLVLKRLLAAYGSLVGDHSLYNSEIKAVPMKEQLDSVSCGWRSQIISDMLEVSQAKTVENTSLFPDMGDVKLMLAFGEGGVSEGVALEEMEEQEGTVEAENLDAPSVVEDVCLNQMEELGATKEEATVGVPPVAYEVPAQNKEENNMDTLMVQEEIGGTREQTEDEIPGMTDDMAATNTIEELGDIREQSKVEVSLMIDDVDVAEPADGMKEVGDTREQPKVEVLPMTDNVAAAEPEESRGYKIRTRVRGVTHHKAYGRREVSRSTTPC
ncbi:hypothetical protein L7F22_002259 [Adiantum nelumboides]|nr:hypothetical protein [Adiantum nelumboides]